MTLFGWDSSDFDWGRGAMDLAAAKADGITWYTHKATEGTGTQHRHLRDAMNRGRAAGIEFLGAYHVVRSAPSAAAQVTYFLAYLDGQVPWWRDFPGFFLQVDLERWPYDNVTPATGKAFAAELKRRSPKTVITYASRGMYQDQLAGIVTPLWNAAYGTNPVAPYRQAYPGDKSTRWAAYSGQTPVMLQYGSRTRIGTQNTCDANAFRGSLEQLRTLITGRPTPLEDGDEMDEYSRNTAWRVQDLIELKPTVVVPETDQAGSPAKYTSPNKLAAKLEEILAAAKLASAGGVDVDGLAELVAEKLKPHLPTAEQVADVLAQRRAG